MDTALDIGCIGVDEGKGSKKREGQVKID